MERWQAYRKQEVVRAVRGEHERLQEEQKREALAFRKELSVRPSLEGLEAAAVLV